MPNVSPSWHVSRQGLVTSADPGWAGFDSARHRLFRAKTFRVPFEIVAGEATYIGNLHLEWRDGVDASLGGIGIVEIANRADRDLKLLREHLPRIRQEQIRVAVIAPH